MRLGQLARKYGVSKNEIVNFLKETDPSLHSLGQNTKLDEPMLRLIASRYENAENFGEEITEETSKPEVVTSTGEEIEEETFDSEEPEEHATEAPKAELNTSTSTADHRSGPEKADKPERSEGQVIETDKLLELLESEDGPVDLSKITLIKAPKKELDGLKVVGKINLPEPRKKPPTHQPRQRGTTAHREGQELSFEEREKRRLSAKKRQEEYQARQEKRRKEKEKKQQKALKRARYKQKLERARVSQVKPKDQGRGTYVMAEVPEPPAPPKTLLGKFWRWLNTY